MSGHRVTVRGFVDQAKVLEDAVLVDDLTDLRVIAEAHIAQMMAWNADDKPFHIEIEFWDGDKFRIGTDKRSMVSPVKLKL